MYTADPEGVKAKYNLPMLREIENLVAEAVEIQVPFNNYITGWCAFTHKAGIHAKAILNNPSTYEILNPEDFGMTRYVSIGHRLTGWNAVKSRVEQLKLEMTDEQIKDATNKIKELADVKTQTMEDVDVILRVYHKAVVAGVLEVGDGDKLDELLDAHRCVPVPAEPVRSTGPGADSWLPLSFVASRSEGEAIEEPAAKRVKTA
jgi:homocitrate synthase